MSMLPAKTRLTPLALSVHLALTGVLTLGMMQPVQAQSTAQNISYEIPAGPLSDALNRFAQQSGVSIVMDAGRLKGLQSAGLKGNYGIDEGFGILLQGSGYTVNKTDAGYVLRPLPAAAAVDTVLPEVSVTAQLEHNIITEGTGSYTSSEVSFAKGQSLREIPQSVSVITRQQIEDQNFTSIGAVLEQTTGITTTVSAGGEVNKIYARGFEVTSVQIDGASVDSYHNILFNPNLAMYDHVEVLRGADGLFSASGEAGGTVNLVRKRPLAHTQVKLAGSLGSWDFRRAEVDVTGAFSKQGAVRARLVGALQQNDFFYDTASDENQFVYGILEAALTPRTLLTVGGSYENRDGTPNWAGLPRYSDGSDIGLPRETSLMADWHRSHFRTTEWFASLEQQLGGDWRIKASTTYMDRSASARRSATWGAINPATGTGYQQYNYSTEYAWTSEKLNFDINTQGSFSLLGGRHELLLGVDGQRLEHNDAYYNGNYPVPMPYDVDIFHFDPSTSLAAPTSVDLTSTSPNWGAHQNGLYGRIKLQLAEPLHLVLGARYANYKYDSDYFEYDPSGAVVYQELYQIEEKGIFTPFGGVVYDLSPEWTTYLSAAEIYKSQAGRLQGPAPGTPLDPIEGRSLELGIKGSLYDSRLNTAVALYRIDRTGEAVFVSSGGMQPNGASCCYEARGKVVSQGVDTEVSGEVLTGLQLTAGYTYNDNSDKTKGSVPYSSITPKHLFKLQSSWQLPGIASAWTTGAGVQAQSTQYLQGSGYRVEQSGYSVWNAFLQYRFLRNWEAAINVNNLFDKTYYQTISTPISGNWYGAPRNAMLTVRGQF